MKKNELHILIENAISYYLEFMEEWFSSYSCCLREEEKDLVKAYISFRDFKGIANDLKSSESKVKFKLKHVSFKLHANRGNYRQWIGEKILIDAGIIKRPSLCEEFLVADFSYHKVSINLYRNLRKTTYENFSELLAQSSIEELFSIKGFGKKSMEELLEYFHQNKFLHLLPNYRNIKRIINTS